MSDDDWPFDWSRPTRALGSTGSRYERYRGVHGSRPPALPPVFITDADAQAIWDAVAAMHGSCAAALAQIGAELAPTVKALAALAAALADPDAPEVPSG